MNIENLYQKLNQLESKIDSLTVTTKSRMTLHEASQYLQVSKSFLYKATSTNQLPFYKPSGKLIYFEKEDLDSWISNCKISSNDQVANNLKIFNND